MRWFAARTSARPRAGRIARASSGRSSRLRRDVRSSGSCTPTRTARARAELARHAPGALVFERGNTEEMIANCAVLVTQFSSTAYVGLALGKEVHSYFDVEELARLCPIQNGSTSAHRIADVCRAVAGFARAGNHARTTMAQRRVAYSTHSDTAMPRTFTQARADYRRFAVDTEFVRMTARPSAAPTGTPARASHRVVAGLIVAADGAADSPRRRRARTRDGRAAALVDARWSCCRR